MDWLFQAKDSRIFEPKSTEELVTFVQTHPGPFAIAGEQYSSGGQTLVNHGTIISFRALPFYFRIYPDQKSYWISAGATWYQVLQELIPLNRVPFAMQSYYSFSVGGSLSVNAHGRNGKRLSDSCCELDVLLMTGEIVRCSSSINSELYFGILGGYGCCGIILKAHLLCSPNFPVYCQVKTTSLSFENISKILSTNPALYNSELTEDGKLVHICWYPLENFDCSCQLTTRSKINPLVESIGKIATRFGQTLLELFPLTLPFYQNYKWDQLDGQKCWYSYVMAEDAKKLTPLTDSLLIKSLLQEYFIPGRNLVRFIRLLRKIFRSFPSITLLNLSIRHCTSESNGGYLDWLNSEDQENKRMCVVLYLSVVDNLMNPVWQEYHELTHRLIQLSYQNEGSWYLPYLPEFNSQDLEKGYPSIQNFREIKKKVDPEDKLQSWFWQRLKE